MLVLTGGQGRRRAFEMCSTILAINNNTTCSDSNTAFVSVTRRMEDTKLANTLHWAAIRPWQWHVTQLESHSVFQLLFLKVLQEHTNAPRVAPIGKEHINSIFVLRLIPLILCTRTTCKRVFISASYCFTFRRQYNVPPGSTFPMPMI